jgi:hypothetical protein
LTDAAGAMLAQTHHNEETRRIFLGKVMPLTPPSVIRMKYICNDVNVWPPLELSEAWPSSCYPA